MAAGTFWNYQSLERTNGAVVEVQVPRVRLMTASNHIGGHWTASEFHSTASDHRRDQDSQKKQPFY